MSTPDHLQQKNGIQENHSTEVTALPQEDALMEGATTTPKNPVDGVTKKDAEDHINQAVATHSEDESAEARHDIEKKEYHAMPPKTLIKELKHLLKTQKIQAIKEHVEELKTEFNNKFSEEFEQKKEEFLADGGNAIDFYYSTPIKKEFNALYFDYKEKRNAYYQNLKKDLQANLKKRLEIIEELKGLLSLDENINTTYTHFKAIRERWSNAGAIPRDKYNTVWNTFHHHVENFYDFLHLNRDFRDLDFKHNLEQKLKIIDRANELAQETNVNRAFRELQLLHKMWKEDLGPVDKEYREVIWEKFSALTKTIHENRQQHYDQLELGYEQNLIVKKEIIAKINTIGEGPAKNHSGWQQKIKEIETLRAQFFEAGKVPSKSNEQTWGQFKESVRAFNRNKNAYYKNQKKEQYDNLHQKQELIKIAEEHKDSEDFEKVTPLIKKIQSDWKKIGHVPHRDSDKIWKQFKTACNHYFDRVHALRNESNKEETDNYTTKLQHLEQLKALQLTGETSADLETLKDNIAAWKKIGRVPYSKKTIERDFNKQLDLFFERLSLNRTETELIKYENKLNAMTNNDDDRALRNEQLYLRKKVDEITGEIRQLENNLQFFKNADQSNPLVKEVHKNIARHQESLQLWKAKLQKIRQL